MKKKGGCIMSKRGVLIWRKIFESGDEKRIGRQKTECPEFADLSDLRIEKDYAYIDDGNQGHLFDIYSLKGCPEDAPVLINIHGGGLFASYKEVNAHSNYQWARRGYKVVSISYRRIPETTLWHQIDDCMAALRYVKAHADELGLNMNDCVLTGDSAGALLSLFCLAINGNEIMQKKFDIAGAGVEFKAAGLISTMFDTQRRDIMMAISDVITGPDDSFRPCKRYLLDPADMIREIDLPPVILVTSKEDLVEKDTLKLDKVLTLNGKEHMLIDYTKGKENKLIHVFAIVQPLYKESIEVFDRMENYFRSR